METAVFVRYESLWCGILLTIFDYLFGSKLVRRRRIDVILRVIPSVHPSETIGHYDLHFGIDGSRSSIEKVLRFTCAYIFPSKFLLTTILHIVYDSAIPATELCHSALVHSVLSPLHLPSRVVVPDIGHYRITLHRVFAHPVCGELGVAVASHRLVIPVHYVVTLYVIDIVAPRNSVAAIETLPEQSAQRSVHVFEDIVLNYEVFGIVLVSRAKMCVIWLQYLIKSLTISDYLIIFFLIPLSLARIPTIRRNVHKENHRVTCRYAFEVLFQPFQLGLL